jgi:hypothetical protein
MKIPPAPLAAFFAAAALSLVAVVLVPAESRAEDPVAPASAAPAPPASASSAAAPSAAPTATTPKLPVFAADLPGDEKSEMPKNDEWKTATAIDFDDRHGNGSGGSDCTVQRIREWVRVTCPGAGSMASLILGDGEGFRALTPIPGPGQSLEKGAHWVQFPFRKGDRKLMEIRSLVPGNYGDGLYVGPGILISAMWLPNERPSLTAH